MSLTFYIASEEIVLGDNKVVVQYTTLYPDGSDHTPVIDPEYGVRGPRNGWSLKDSDETFKMLADLLMIAYEESEYGIESGVIGNLDELIAACDNTLATLRMFPELERQILILVEPVREEERIQVVSPADSGNHVAVIECDRPRGYIESSVSALRELAVIAKQKDAVLCYAFDSAN
jgi:hypothetical protein